MNNPTVIMLRPEQILTALECYLRDHKKINKYEKISSIHLDMSPLGIIDGIIILVGDKEKELASVLKE